MGGVCRQDMPACVTYICDITALGCGRPDVRCTGPLSIVSHWDTGSELGYAADDDDTTAIEAPSTIDANNPAGGQAGPRKAY